MDTSYDEFKHRWLEDFIPADEYLLQDLYDAIKNIGEASIDESMRNLFTFIRKRFRIPNTFSTFSKLANKLHDLLQSYGDPWTLTLTIFISSARVLEYTSKLGHWDLDEIIDRANSYDNLKVFLNKLNVQYTNKSISENWFKAIFGLENLPPDIDNVLSNRSYTTQSSIYEDIKKIVLENFLYGKDSEEEFEEHSYVNSFSSLISQPKQGLQVGNRTWSHLSGPIEVIILVPTTFDLPSFVLLGDVHENVGDCNMDVNTESMTSSGFLESLNKLSFTGHPLDLSIEVWFQQDYTAMLLDLEVSSGKNTIHNLVFNKRIASSKDTMFNLYYNNQICFWRSQLNSARLTASNLDCKYKNIRWQLADPRHSFLLNFPFDSLVRIVMQYILFSVHKNNPNNTFEDVCKEVNELVDSFESFSEFKDFFTDFVKLYLYMLESIDVQERASGFVNTFFDKKKFSGISILHKYVKEQYKFIGVEVQDLYTYLIGYYTTICKGHEWCTVNEAKSQQCYKNLETFFRRIFVRVKQLRNKNVTIARDTPSIEDIPKEDYHNFILSIQRFILPMMDTYFLIRSTKHLNKPIKTESNENVSPWLHVLYAGNSHCKAITHVLTRELGLYKIASQNSLAGGKNHCVEFTQRYSLNNLRAKYQTYDLLSKYTKK